MLGFYNYTVYLTYTGLLSAVTGMFLAFAGNIRAAVICLLVSGFCDMFDGKIARTKKDRTEEEKNFGIQIDSLCDAVCFGVLPAVITCAAGADRWWQLAVAALFVLAGIIRLGYFNVVEEVRQKTETGNRKTYTGLPITASALFIPLVMSLQSVLGKAGPYVLTGTLAVLAVCYVAPISVKKPGKWGGVVMLLLGAGILALILILT